MIVFVALVIISSSLAEDDIRRILRSPKATLKLYSDFKAGEGLKYSGSEDRLRFRLFRHSAELVADFNEHDKSAKFGINFFSSMTEDEKKQYLGMNITEREETPVLAIERPSVLKAPVEKFWTNELAVTRVKNQGSCGSCWTFAAVGGLETRYKLESGKLRNFAEQEYLDCVYEGKSDGCQGGWANTAYMWSYDNGGRLPATSSYRYVQRDGPCQKNSKPDAMVAVKLLGYVPIRGNEAANIEALATGSLAVAFEVTTHFFQYKSGIMKDTTCKGAINHGVTAVGYNAKYVLVKNSWGAQWGESGFVKFARGHDNCGLFQISSYPRLIKTGKQDNTPSDAATSYRAASDVKPKPVCKDNLTNCSQYTHLCEHYTKWAGMKCAKTCGIC